MKTKNGYCMAKTKHSSDYTHSYYASDHDNETNKYSPRSTLVTVNKL